MQKLKKPFRKAYNNYAVQKSIKMPSHNETKIHVSTNLHVCIENLDEGGERKRKKYMRRSKKRTGLQPKNVFEKRGMKRVTRFWA